MHYRQRYNTSAIVSTSSHPNVLQLPDLTPGFVLEDDVLKHVRTAYDRIMDDEATQFMIFDDREGAGAADDRDDTNVYYS